MKKSIKVVDDEQDKLVVKAKLGHTVADLERLAEEDLERTERQLNVRARLREERKLELEQEQTIQFQKTMLLDWQRQEDEREAGIHMCAMSGHKREDGSTAIGGQRDSRNVLNAVCQRCQAVFVGVGDGEGQLAPIYANMLDQNLIGG